MFAAAIAKAGVPAGTPIVLHRARNRVQVTAHMSREGLSRTPVWREDIEVGGDAGLFWLRRE
jgi:hypothetical protein